ncbi:uncharacterized protein NFIA_043830 [Aspergillus fischeri NRRL 181]|uniref:Galactosyl transferase GMA12/MNN10 family protein n=1 Tax=Neosartorya fischeri (strain ATCC 1020 / DSM 3700 / CBS 544.65 / FGSC A1164 / JCM 1740 / NRRL 181 / WB 181) TaxID=331117 RepID=A1CUY7_NEOFI|nr:uncharacterized protein NFIA_043830 [Aspergillus fischeri NRRL 181]EAW25564.1 hypothetical protein NFIA_043830 [Aspergillus fischeri NRRL 181]
MLLDYAQLHGYDLHVDYESHSTRGTTWLKFDMIERLINTSQYDWIWWIDFDTLITNTTMSLADIISESLASSSVPDMIDFIVTDDWAKNSGKSWNDQESMAEFLQSKTPLIEHAIRIPQWRINAFPEEIGCYDSHKKKWEKGMFVIHFAGAWAHVVEEDPTGHLMRKYESQIV